MNVQSREIAARELVASYEEKGCEGVVSYGAALEIRPADITNATLTADFNGSILSWIDETAVVFSNGVTRAPGPSPHPDYAAFTFALDIPSVVSRSTNELWHWSATSINGHELPSSVYVATNGPGVAYSILGEHTFVVVPSSIHPHRNHENKTIRTRASRPHFGISYASGNEPG